MNPSLMALTLVVALGMFSFTMIRRIRLWAKMAPENRLDQPIERLKLLFGRGFGQSRLIGREKERSSGIMHAFIFWGAVLISIREFTAMGEGFVPGFQELIPLLGADSVGAYLYAFVYDLFEVLVLLMVGFALYRRLVLRPERLDLNAEGILVLVFIGGIMATDLIFNAGRFNLIAGGQDLHMLTHPVFGTERDWSPFASLLATATAPLGEMTHAFFYEFGFWTHVVVMLTFLNYLPYTKQFHEVTALPNIFFGSVGRPHTPIALLDCEDEKAWEDESLGVNRVEQLTWKQGLDLYTCTECGRCFDICPTYVTDKPLTMKWVNDSLRLHLEDQGNNIRKTGASAEDVSLVGDVISPETLWACTTCRACEAVCPVSIEHVPRIISMRQGQTLMAEAQPKELNSAFKGLDQNGNPWGIGYDQRADWAKDEDIIVLEGVLGEDAEVLMWVGCMGSFDNRNQKIAKATSTLLKKAGVSFAILGSREKCTGDLARRSGNEMLYQILAQENINTLNEAKVTRIVTQCPHCLNSLKNEYPQLEGKFEVFHHSQFIAQLVADGRLKLTPEGSERITFHDPCYLGRYNEEYDAPRSLLDKACGGERVEMKRNREESFCCGAGGARMWMEETIGSRINEERVRQAGETGATTIATACPFCMTMVSDGVKAAGKEEEIQVLDIAEMVLKAVDKGVK